MSSNIDRHKKDLEALSHRGEELLLALAVMADYENFRKELLERYGGDESKVKAMLDAVPSFRASYQSWYSEALSLVKNVLPDRLNDFCRLYEKPKARKSVTAENYTIEDALYCLEITRPYNKQKIVGVDAGLNPFRQQLAILEAAKRRFESSLFDIRQTLQADIFDSELEAAEHLLKCKFGRAAGALAGVVIEKHLSEVASNHAVVRKKKDATIADLNEALKAADVIDIPTWRFIQHLADIRNLCDHNKSKEPTIEQVQDLLDGTAKLIKTVF